MAQTVQDNLSVTESTGSSSANLSTTPTASTVLLESGGNSLRVGVDNTSGASIGTVNAFSFALRTGGEPRIFIEGDGDVGIGTTASPTAKLEVAGAVKADSFQGDGAMLTGVVKTTGDTMTGPLSIQGNLAVQGDTQTRNLTVQNNLTVVGNLDVTGTTTFRNIEQHQGDLELGNQDTDQVRIHGVVRSTHTSGVLQVGSPLTVAGSITATAFRGNGSGLTGILRTGVFAANTIAIAANAEVRIAYARDEGKNHRFFIASVTPAINSAAVEWEYGVSIDADGDRTYTLVIKNLSPKVIQISYRVYEILIP